MWRDSEEVLFDLLTRDAWLVWKGQLYRLEGPFGSKTEAVRAADELKGWIWEGQEVA